MRRALQIASYLALAGIVIPPILYFRGELPQDGMNTITLLATILWFAVTPFWMNDRTRT